VLRHSLIALRATLVFAVITGILFPLIITAIAQVLFPHQANGSLIVDGAGKILGSSLIGQKFVLPRYFHPRPSAAGSGYAGEASSGTNLGPTSAKLILGQKDDPTTKDVDESFAGIKQLAEAYRAENGLPPDYLVPVDAVTRSGSGLDPDISPTNALSQAKRVAQARRVPLATVITLIQKHTQTRQIGFLGEPTVNVLKLNIDLDK
jgi:potassium-transporting ATPase KdpC subunit